MPTINYNAALPPDIYTQVGVGSINIGNYINSLKVNLNQLITLLFANSEQGFTQTLDDYSILFQDAAGTTALTGAGQTLGLVLDKSKGLVLGSELVGDPSFNNPAYWSVASGVSVSGGNAVFTNASSGNGLSKNGLTTLGKTYKVVVNVASITSGSLVVLTGVGTGSLLSPNITSAGTYTFLLPALGTVAIVRINSNNTSTNAIVSDISIKEISGNHSYQTTSSYRPLLQNTPRRVQYDGFDDKLTTTLAAQLTGCTVIRAIPNVGCQILINQTIPTTYNDSTSHCGLIVINRALTAYETSQLTQIFNKLAGV